MSHAPITPSSRYLYCVPPHTHALLRYRVHRVTPDYMAYHADSGVAVNRISGAPLGPEPDLDLAGPLRIVPRDQIDVARAWEGAPPDTATYYSTFEAFQRLQEVALVQYGLEPPEDEEVAWELETLRRRMMDAHPDRGGSVAAFTEARKAYEGLRRRFGI